MKKPWIHSKKKKRYRKPVVLPEKFIAGGNTGDKWIIWVAASLTIHFIAFAGLASQQNRSLDMEISMEDGIQSIASAYFIPIQPEPPPPQETVSVPLPPQEDIQILTVEDEAPIEVAFIEPEPQIEEEIIEELPPVEIESEPTQKELPTEETELITQLPQEDIQEYIPENPEPTQQPFVAGNSEDTFSLPSAESFGTENDNPNATVCPSPRYPPIAIRRSVEGTVILNVTINADGKPTDVTVLESSGYNYFDDEAVRTVLNRWQFDSTHPKSNFRLKIDFRLKK